ncbi:MAG: DUF2142 domain-containing protein [Chloroflexi bacterium]|nr:DUF2142 domain-containing protein [Chloroflexota bacterium]
MTHGKWVLTLIVVVYVVLAAGYATVTPHWQNPDEPAHYNYIRHLAQGHGLPVLQMGDYDAAYLEQLKAAGFPANLSIDSVRYEGYQPPLYYLLAVPMYGASAGLGLDAQILALRLFSVALGALLIVTAYAVARQVLDDAPGAGAIVLGAAAFVAFLPMHTAMTAAINNDTLAELLISVLLWLMIRRLRDRITPRRYVMLAGVLLGLTLLTKVSTYLVIPLLLFVELARWLPRDRRDMRAALSTLLTIAVLALLLSVPWFARNMLVYGPTDPIGKGRHDAVVVGQLTTAAFAAQHGWLRLGQDFLVTSFHSFWGQFGWMGLVLDTRVYMLLLALSVVAGVGLVVRFGRGSPSTRINADSRKNLYTSATIYTLLALTILLALGVYVGYNLTLLQHQGRYLFPAIVPLGVFFAVGLWAAWQRRASLVVAGALALVLVVRLLTGLFASGSGVFDAALWGGGAALLAGRALAPGQRVGYLAYAACLVALALIDVWCLVGFVLPYFRP